MVSLLNSAIKNNLKRIKFIRLLLYKIKSGYKKYQVFDFLSKDSIVIDIGANIGEVSTYINDKFGCQIYCYEPHPGAFKCLEKKFKKSKNISIFNCAVSNQNTEKNFYLHKESPNENDLTFSQASSLEEKKENISLEKRVIVKCIHINDILKKFKKIDCIKIDIEGHEYKIIPFLIQNKSLIKKVICELHGSDSATSTNIKNAFLRPDYQSTISTLKEKKLYNNWFVEWI